MRLPTSFGPHSAPPPSQNAWCGTQASCHHQARYYWLGFCQFWGVVTHRVCRISGLCIGRFQVYCWSQLSSAGFWQGARMQVPNPAIKRGAEMHSISAPFDSGRP